LPLKQAQMAIAKNWIEAYLRYRSPRHKDKGVRNPAQPRTR
jgi:hypothetical protein